jgi:hypothetical protein
MRLLPQAARRGTRKAIIAVAARVGRAEAQKTANRPIRRLQQIGLNVQVATA